MKTKTISIKDRRSFHVRSCPSFHVSGSITGMKRRFYGMDAKLVRCGSWIYNTSANWRAEAVYNELP